VGAHVIPLAVSQKEKRRQEGRIWIGFIEAGSGEGGRKKGSKTRRPITVEVILRVKVEQISIEWRELEVVGM